MNRKRFSTFELAFYIFAACVVMRLLCGSARAATGDILSVTVMTGGTETDGVREQVKISGFGPFAGAVTYSLGTTTANFKIVNTVTSPGYTGTSLGTKSRTSYADFNTYKEHPPANSYAVMETVSGADLIVELALSEPIYVSDTATVDVAAGFATHSATNTTHFAGSVTNSSTLVYGKMSLRFEGVTDANGVYVPPHGRVATSTITVEAQSMHMHGNPILVFNAFDENLHTAVSGNITARTKSGRDGWPVYSGTLDLSGFHSGDIVTIDVTAYPQIGNTTNKDTSTGTAFPSLELCSYPVLLDTAATFHQTVAYCDSVNGTSGGVAADIANDATARASPFQTWGQCQAAIAVFNNSNYSRNNVDLGILYLLNGNQSSGVGASTLKANTKGVFTVKVASGVSPWSVPVTAPASSKYMPDFTYFDGVIFAPSLSANQTMLQFQSGAVPVFHNCKIFGINPDNQNPFWTDDGPTYAVHDGTQMWNYFIGLGTFGSNTRSIIHRNCFVIGAGNFAFRNGRNMLGSIYLGTRAGVQDGFWEPSVANNGNIIIAWCQAYHCLNSALFLQLDTARLNVMECVFERVDSSGSQIVQLGDGANITDFLYCHNTNKGNRFGFLNLIDNTTPDYILQRQCFYNNAMVYWAVRDHSADTSATLVGWRPVQYGTSCAHNNDEYTANSLNAYFGGIDYTLTGESPNALYTAPAAYHSAYEPSGTNLGHGDYTPAANSPLLARAGSNVYAEFDLNGRPIPTDGTGAIGAYQPATFTRAKSANLPFTLTVPTP